MLTSAFFIPFFFWEVFFVYKLNKGAIEKKLNFINITQDLK